jgi:(2R)-ethylmalonyl-CoA mutase
VQRIVLEMLAVTLSKDARARSVQLPAWNEALGLPRPWDQQWSLRMQQVLAYETDLLEYGDLFTGSHVVESKTKELADAAWTELQEILTLGGAFENVELLKGRLVSSMVERTRRIESGELSVVGVNVFTESTESPLGGDDNILTVDRSIEETLINDVRQWRKDRDNGRVEAAKTALADDVRSGRNVMPASIALAQAGGTTGEWADILRETFGEYRAPTGVGAAAGRRAKELHEVAEFVQRIPGGPPKVLIAKPGLDGHSSGAEQIAVAARDSGMEVVYSGIRLTPEQIAASARDEDADLVGLSILSGSHRELVPSVIDHMTKFGVDSPVIVGGIIPEVDQRFFLDNGVAAVYTPKDFDIARIMGDIARIVDARRRANR